MANYYVRCPTTMEEKEFDSRKAAEAWVEEHNEINPPGDGEPAAQIFTRTEWEASYADAG